MNRDSRLDRFAELDAGRALGDLDSQEAAEWRSLAAELGERACGEFDLLAGEIEAATIEKSFPLPESISRAVIAQLQQTPKVITFPAPAPRRRSRGNFSQWAGWAAAACLLGLLAIREANRPVTLPAPPVSMQTPSEQRDFLVSTATDVVQLPFSAAAAPYQGMKGQVVWSDSLQQGFMTFTNLPANSPGHRQYQLWIVDPARDEFPVDGGVFDIPAGHETVVIPIQAKLAVDRPAAFVVTLEKPGGVVRSKQETVVALAKS